MSKPFPTFDLSRVPTWESWREELATDPTIRTPFEAGAILTRPRYTSIPRMFRFTYNFLTKADRDILVDYENHVSIGASKFTFRHPITDEDWEMRLSTNIKMGIEPKLYGTYYARIEMFGKEITKMRQEIIEVEDLGAGLDISTRPMFVSPIAITINSIGILTKAPPAAVDDANTVVIDVKDDGGNTIVSKTYDTSNQPPSSDYEDLGNLSNQSMNAGEHVTLAVTQGASANMPAFVLIIEYYYT